MLGKGSTQRNDPYDISRNIVAVTQPRHHGQTEVATASKRATLSLESRLQIIPLFLVAVFFPSLSLGQHQAGDWAAFTSMGIVNALLAEEQGVWAATQGGVLHYDIARQKYSHFTTVDNLAGNQVLSITADENGHLWFGTNGSGLSRFRPETGYFDPPVQIFRKLRVNALVVAEDRMFVGTDKGISVLLLEVERVKENYRYLGGPSQSAEVTSIAVLDGRLWAGTTEGMAWAELDAANLQDPDSWNFTNVTGQVKDLLILHGQLFCAGQTQIWAFRPGTNTWVIDADFEAKALGQFNDLAIAVHERNVLYRRLAQQTWEKMEGHVGEVLALSRFSDELWVATSTGLRKWNDPLLPTPEEPASNHFFDMTQTPDGNLWIATVPNDRSGPAQGIYQFDGIKWTVHNTRSGGPPDKSVALETDLAGNLWVGTWGEGLAVRSKDGQWHQLNERNSVLRGITQPNAPSFVVLGDIKRDAEDLIWITNLQAGLAVMESYPSKRGLLHGLDILGLRPGGTPLKLAIDSKGLKWIATIGDGFILFDDGGTPFRLGDERSIIVNTGNESRLSSNDITAIFVDDRDLLWVGTENGLHIIRAAYDRASGELDVITWRSYNLDNGLRSASITSIEADNGGNVWVGTKKGLIQFAPTGLLAFTFTSSNSDLIDDQVESLLFDDNRRELWVGTFQGLGRLRTNQVQKSKKNRVTVYPNPFPLQHPYQKLTFAGLSPSSTVRILTLDGKLVKHITSAPSNSSVSWNGCNTYGDLVGSGVYYFLVVDPIGQATVGKFGVLRRGRDSQ